MIFYLLFSDYKNIILNLGVLPLCLPQLKNTLESTTAYRLLWAAADTTPSNTFFLDRLITGAEKWIFYHYVKRRRQWISRGNRHVQQPRDGLYPKRYGGLFKELSITNY